MPDHQCNLYFICVNREDENQSKQLLDAPTLAGGPHGVNVV